METGCPNLKCGCINYQNQRRALWSTEQCKYYSSQRDITRHLNIKCTFLDLQPIGTSYLQITKHYNYFHFGHGHSRANDHFTLLIILRLHYCSKRSVPWSFGHIFLCFQDVKRPIYIFIGKIDISLTYISHWKKPYTKLFFWN